MSTGRFALAPESGKEEGRSDFLRSIFLYRRMQDSLSQSRVCLLPAVLPPFIHKDSFSLQIVCNLGTNIFSGCFLLPLFSVYLILRYDILRLTFFKMVSHEIMKNMVTHEIYLIVVQKL